MALGEGAVLNSATLEGGGGARGDDNDRSLVGGSGAEARGELGTDGARDIGGEGAAPRGDTLPDIFDDMPAESS